jgi:hypothetical protein
MIVLPRLPHRKEVRATSARARMTEEQDRHRLRRLTPRRRQLLPRRRFLFGCISFACLKKLLLGVWVSRGRVVLYSCQLLRNGSICMRDMDGIWGGFVISVA